jgi:cobalt-zinc-cadmium efflux system outer membrane protein
MPTATAPTRPTLLLASLAALLSGCASYHPAPISAAQNAQAIQARSLDDARLREFIAATRTAGAAPDAGEPEWDLATLTLAALYYHPTLDLARADVDEARAGVLTARQFPNPSLSFEDLAFTPGAAAGAAWTIAPVINFLIETSAKRAKRTAQANAQLQAARAELAGAAWQVRGGVRDALIDIWAAGRRLELLRSRLAIQEQLAALLNSRYDAGEDPGLELARERTNANQLRLTVEEADAQSTAARIRLAAAIGIPLRALDGIHLSYRAIDAAGPDDAVVGGDALWQEALINRSDVQELLAEYAAAESALALEIANQYPNLTLSPGYAWDQGQHRYLLMPAGDLPIFNRNQGEIARALARREQAAARFTSLQTQIINAIDGVTARYSAANRTLAAADALLRDERDRESQAARFFKEGETEHASVLSVQLERISAEQSRLDAFVQHQEALAALEDALQHAFFGPAIPGGAETNPRLAIR